MYSAHTYIPSPAQPRRPRRANSRGISDGAAYHSAIGFTRSAPLVTPTNRAAGPGNSRRHFNENPSHHPGVPARHSHRPCRSRRLPFTGQSAQSLHPSLPARRPPNRRPIGLRRGLPDHDHPKRTVHPQSGLHGRRRLVRPLCEPLPSTRAWGPQLTAASPGSTRPRERASVPASPLVRVAEAGAGGSR